MRRSTCFVTTNYSTPKFLTASHCESVMAQGCPFTWKKRVHGSWIYERLDRGLARRDFCNLYPNIGAIHGAFTFSDHCPIVFDTNPNDHYPKACPFRFQNFWTKYFHVEHTVKTKWRVTEKGTHMYRFTRKLKIIKTELKPWVKSLSLIHI